MTIKERNEMDKVCVGCDKTKKGVEFNKNKSKSDGLNSYCKKCSREYQSYWQKINKVKKNYQNLLSQKDKKMFNLVSTLSNYNSAGFQIGEGIESEYFSSNFKIKK